MAFSLIMMKDTPAFSLERWLTRGTVNAIHDRALLLYSAMMESMVVTASPR